MNCRSQTVIKKKYFYLFPFNATAAPYYQILYFNRVIRQPELRIHKNIF